jgi:hypothetical protein
MLWGTGVIHQSVFGSMNDAHRAGRMFQDDRASPTPDDDKGRSHRTYRIMQPEFERSLTCSFI